MGAPIWDLLLRAQLTALQQWLCLVTLLLLIPASIGLFWSYVLQNDLIEKHAPLGLFAVHHATTAWDWKLSRLKSTEWILVTLKDGTQHAGYVSGESFFASGPDNRDLYIEQVYELTENNEWKHPGRRKSILIPYSEVRSIVFWPDEIEVNHDGEKSVSELPEANFASPSDNGRV